MSLYKYKATCERCQNEFDTDCKKGKVCTNCTRERRLELKEEQLLLKKGKKHLNT